MGTRRRNISEDRLSITTGRSNTRSKSSDDNDDGRENSDPIPIPIDLVSEILLRLPAKSIARCRRVSKLWGSILRRPDFTEMFLTRSLARPRLLFASHKGGDLFFFTSPQNNNKSSSPLATSYHMKFSFDVSSSRVCRPVHGLICLKHLRISNGRTETETVLVICNPTTGQFLPLPKVNTRRIKVRSFLGYDPIEKQFKVLSMTSTNYGRESVFEEHQVLTLGTGSSWRKIECCVPHYPSPVRLHEICIDGVLYYKAAVDKSREDSMVVCFDVRSEKFRFIQVEEPFIKVPDAIFVNYNGRLASLVSHKSGFVDGTSRSLKLWVLGDSEKQGWSKHKYLLPDLWRDMVGEDYLKFVGVTQTNEIVLKSCGGRNMPFFVFYYDMERKTMVRLEIQGMEAFEYNEVYTFVDHVEDVKLMQAL